jgi:hypothetical protein
MDRIGANLARSSLSSGATEAPGLRVGASVILRALEPATEGRWTVLVNGKRLTTTVSIPLSSGLQYSARVDRLPDSPGWILHILGRVSEGQIGRDPAAEFLRSAGLTGDPLTALILRALMGEFLPLDPKNIARLRAALSKHEADGDRAATLARALAKGLDPEETADALEAARSMADAGARGSDGGAESGGAETGGRNHERESPDGRRPEPASGGQSSENDSSAAGETVCGPGWKDFLCPEPETDALAGLFKFLAARSSSEPNAYQLFNARPSLRGRWIYVPYRFQREGVAFSGTLRILIDHGSDQLNVLAADIQTEGKSKAEGRYAFALRRKGNGLSLSLSAVDSDAKGILPREASVLARELEARGCSLELVPNDFWDGSFDGSLEERNSVYEPVDDHA